MHVAHPSMCYCLLDLSVDHECRGGCWPPKYVYGLLDLSVDNECRDGRER